MHIHDKKVMQSILGSISKQIRKRENYYRTFREDKLKVIQGVQDLYQHRKHVKIIKTTQFYHCKAGNITRHTTGNINLWMFSCFLFVPTFSSCLVLHLLIQLSARQPKLHNFQKFRCGKQSYRNIFIQNSDLTKSTVALHISSLEEAQLRNLTVYHCRRKLVALHRASWHARKSCITHKETKVIYFLISTLQHHTT